MPRGIIVTVPDLNNRVLYPDLGPNVILLEPQTRTLKLVITHQKIPYSLKFKRHAIPFSSARVITDYKSQGRNFDTTIVDLTKPPTGCKHSTYGLSLYVILSRATTLAGIHILRRAPDNHLTGTLPKQLINEWDRLTDLASSSDSNFWSEVMLARWHAETG